MKRIFILISLLFLAACQETTPINNKGLTEETILEEAEVIEKTEKSEEKPIFLVKARTGFFKVYEDEKFKSSSMLNTPELSVTEVMVDNDNFVYYKVLVENKILYLNPMECLISEVIDHKYDDILVPTIYLDKVSFFEPIISGKFVRSYLLYDLLINGAEPSSDFTFKNRTEYTLQVIAKDEEGNLYETDVIDLYADSDAFRCTVREGMDENTKVLKVFRLVSEFEDRIVRCSLYYDGWSYGYLYHIKLDNGQIGYSLDRLYMLENIRYLTIHSNNDYHIFENVNFNAYNSDPIVQVEHLEGGKISFVNMENGKMFDTYGSGTSIGKKYVVTSNQTDSTEYAEITFRDAYTFETLASIEGYLYMYSRNFHAVEGGYEFQLELDAYEYWPMYENNKLKVEAIFYVDDYRVELSSEDIVEPFMTDISLYDQAGIYGSVIDTFNSDDIDEVKNLKLIDLRDGEIVYWYEIKTKDGKLGYAFRPRYNFEIESDLYHGDYAIVTHDEHLILDEIGVFDGQSNITITSELADYNFYEFSAMSNSRVKALLDYDSGTVYKSNYSKYNDLMIMSLSEKERLDDYESEVFLYEDDRLTKVTLQNAIAENFIWVDENFISFAIRDYQKSYLSILKKVDNNWVIESDFKNFIID